MDAVIVLSYFGFNSLGNSSLLEFLRTEKLSFRASNLQAFIEHLVYASPRTRSMLVSIISMCM